MLGSSPTLNALNLSENSARIKVFDVVSSMDVSVMALALFFSQIKCIAHVRFSYFTVNTEST